MALDRLIGGFGAAASGAEIIVMDDGFRNPSFRMDRSVVVIDAVVGSGRAARGTGRTSVAPRGSRAVGEAGQGLP